MLDCDINRLIHHTFSHRTNQKNSLSSTVRRLIGTPKATLYDVLRELTAKSAMSRIVVVKRLPLWLYSYSSLLISRVSGLFLLVGAKEDNPDDKK